MYSAPIAAAVGLPHRFENLAQHRLRLGTGGEGAGAEGTAEIGLGEAVIGRIEFRDRRPFLAFQGVEVAPSDCPGNDRR